MFEFEGVEFLGPSLVMGNKEGKPVFEMKRKDPSGGKMYYIFKVHEENMTAEEKTGFKVVFETLILPAAAKLDLPMYSFDEILERSTEKIEEIGVENFPKDGSQIDVKIEVYDHAAKNLDNLTVGLNVGQSKPS